MSELSPGTVCYIHRSVQHHQFNGMVVEVVGYYPNEDEPGEWYQVEGAWVRAAFPDCALIAERGNLLPITPPAPEATQRTEAVEPRVA